jgi:signal peptidase II
MPDQANPQPEAAATVAGPPPFRRAGRSRLAVTRFLAVMLVVLTADLVLKNWSFEHVAGRPVVLTDDHALDHRGFWLGYAHESIVIVPRVLELRLTTNTGAVFGLGKGNRVAFILISAIATAVIGIMFWRSPARSWGLHLALALILAGALGNLYDRIRFAAVRDMLHMLPGVHLPFGLAWPGGVREVWPWIFNLADVALLTGVGLVLLISWFAPPPPPKRKN